MIEKYGTKWPNGTNDLAIELACIRQGGSWIGRNKQQCGLGMFEHMMNARKLLWPERYRHRWTDLMYQEFIRNDLTVLLGAASTQKTSHGVEFCLLSYWAKPNNTLVILSTINMDKLDIGVWAELKKLWAAAKDRHPELDGNIVEYKRAITTDNIEDGDVRDFRRGCICRPCYQSGKWIGLGILAGTKQENIIYFCDELQFMAPAFSGSWPHLFANGNVKIIGSGNPKHDPYDELGKTAEPRDGWNSMPEPQKTTVWDTKFMGGRCVNLVGTDSPNFDVPENVPVPFPALISRKFANRIAHDNEAGVESFEYYRLVKGVMKISFAKDRVINKPLCQRHRALDKAVWQDNNKTIVYGLDPTYGGEDRCIGVPLTFGTSIEGKQIIEIGPYRSFGLNMMRIEERSVEDQIADIVAEELTTYGIAPTNVFYDATGKGTIGGAFARKFGHQAPVAVDSGAMPTERPVRDGLFVNDEKTGQSRLKTCKEHYSKFVSEMWFAVRYAIESEQLRGLPEDMMMEGCARIYYMVGGNKIEVEPKSDPKKAEDLKRRLGKSPDLFDALAIGIEGARQRGFMIAQLANAANVDGDDDFFDEEAKEYEKAINDNLLTHA